MAGQIKGITIEFDGNTTKLETALKKVNRTTRSLNTDLKNVDRALKFNPSNIELWQQKQNLLNKKVTETKTKLDALKQAQDKMDGSNVDKNSQEYMELRREIIQTESQLKTFESQAKSVGNIKLRALSSQVEEVGNKFTKVGEAEC